MSETPFLAITDDLFLPRSELGYRASRSGGPGGQHVNTSSTRVELVWDVANSRSLTEEQRARITEKLKGRINSEGLLLIAASNHRSQHQNKEEATRRLEALLQEALHVPKPRRRTRPPRAAKESRLEEKRQRSETKRLRGAVRLD